MVKDTLPEIRAEAKRLGIPWAWVLALKDDMISNERAKRERTDGARELAWHCHVGAASGSAPFWRHGFLARFATRIARGADFTCIPKYDEIASAVAEEFPEYGGEHAGDVSGTERLFELLLSDYERWPSREDFYWRAIDQLQEQVAATAKEQACPAAPF